MVADDATITAGGNIGSDDNPLDVNADNLTTTSGGDTNLDLTSPSTNVDVTAGGTVDIDSTGAVQGKASGTGIDIVADGDIGSPTKPFEATLPNVGDRPIAVSNYGGVWVKKLPQEFTLTLNLNGGTLDGQTGTITIVLNDGSVFVLPLPTREGYRFLYWLGSIYYAGDEYLVVAGHTFTAVWEKIVDPEPDPEAQPDPKRRRQPRAGAADRRQHGHGPHRDARPRWPRAHARRPAPQEGGGRGLAPRHKFDQRGRVRTARPLSRPKALG